MQILDLKNLNPLMDEKRIKEYMKSLPKLLHFQKISVMVFRQKKSHQEEEFKESKKKNSKN